MKRRLTTEHVGTDPRYLLARGQGLPQQSCRNLRAGLDVSQPLGKPRVRDLCRRRLGG